MTVLLKYDAREAQQQLQPLVDQLIRLIWEAPLDAKERNGLALGITSSFIGATCRFVQEGSAELKELPLPELVRAVTNMVVSMMETDGQTKQ